ncbi:MAG: sulfate/molybdate ABC transporter ATP-binding protein [Capsulimonadaceae bacterium]
MSIEVRNVSKQFGGFKALDNVSVRIEEGEMMALLGPSGSGKTTLLRIIAGLESAETGSVLLGGEDASTRSARQRQVGFVFQHYALFRHMTVFENIAFGLRVKPRRERPSRAEIDSRVTELIRMVQLEGMANRHPSQLSGGQRQRVALARALAVQPKMLLLDEPFGALDARVRVELRHWLRRLHQDLKITCVFVTHDQEEALEVADRVVVMNEGRVEQIGTPEEVYDTPANPFVYTFLGSVNLFHGRAHDGLVDVGPFSIESPEHAGQDAPAVAYVRPHELEVVRSRNGHPAVEATVEHIHTIGPIVRLQLRRRDGSGIIEAEVTRERYRELKLRVGEDVHVKPYKMQVFLEEDYSI